MAIHAVGSDEASTPQVEELAQIIGVQPATHWCATEAVQAAERIVADWLPEHDRAVIAAASRP